jgi:hemoglobin-like flavoprotein
MTPGSVELIRTSWQQVLPIRDTAAELFYGRLFELDPALRSLFKGDMGEQGRKLMTMIGMVVNSLERLDGLLPQIEELGRRHVGYGVEAAHYVTVGDALLWTLGKGLGPGFTPAVEAAWTEAYSALASAMKQAAYPTT